MGLLDGILGEVGGLMGGGQGQHADLLSGLFGMLGGQGGGALQGLVQAFEQKGLGQVVSSWVGTGQNLPVSADQIAHVLGGDQLAALAGKVGLTPQAAGAMLSQVLPGVIDKLTPNGQMPAGGGGLGDLLGLLGGLKR